jgi:L-iditol 2-dehydrogenase
MLKAAVTGVRQATLVDVPTPHAKANWALVQVQAAPMCTEYKAFVSGQKNEYLGHEASGVVVEVAQPGRVKVGDRVVVMPTTPCGKCPLCVAGDYIHCQNMVDIARFTASREGNATYAQYILKPDWLLPAIPDGLSYEQGSLACCALGPSFGAFDTMGLGAFDTVLITGAGPVGLGAIVNARFRGARVLVAEMVPWRVERATAMGVAVVLDPREASTVQQIMDLTHARGVDCSLDCSGTVAAQRLCIDATRRKGKVAFVGECNDELPIHVSPDMIRKGLTIIGSWHYNLRLFPQIVQVIQQSPIIDLLVSHVLPMSRIQEAFELCASHQCAKVILKPWE